MEDRYEIRGKIGQGGLGSVYRAFDRKMNREVAIKRIMTSGEDGLAEEATRQLLKEAGALASLQHPHIVTVHDFGSDQDGPFVVMELIAGKTLDEIILHAPLTWPDFRELAMQTLEALIAAQDLDLIHSDLKPSNLMLTWLPSGKFQVKVVDFGLAVLTQSQCRKEIEEMDAVFGSIFFMPPEQFQRVPLNWRSDLYSIGCVYYQALTSHYPFNGRSANEVMESHLQHKVIPLHELRDDIPQWVCDWVMWHINRNPQERPESAREALAMFLKNDRMANPPMSRGKSTDDEPKRPKLIIPAGNSVEEETAPAAGSSSTPAASTPTPAIAPSSAQAPAPPQPAKPSTTIAAPSLSADSVPQATSVPKQPPAQAPQSTTPSSPASAPPPLLTPEKPAKVETIVPPIFAKAKASLAGEKGDSMPVPNPAPASPLTAAAFTHEPTPIATKSPAQSPKDQPIISSRVQLPKPPAKEPVLPVKAITPDANPTPPSPASPTPLPAQDIPATPLPPFPTPLPEATPAFPAAPPAAPDGSEPPNPATSKTRAFERPKLVLNKRSQDDLQKSSAHYVGTGTSLQATVPSATGPHPVIAPPATASHAIPQQPAVPTSTGPVAAAPSSSTQAHATLSQAVSPQPLQPPVGSKPSIHTTQIHHDAAAAATTQTSLHATPKPGSPNQALATPANQNARVVAVTPTKVNTVAPAIAPKRKRSLSNAVKGMIATFLIISIALVSWVLLERLGSNRDAETLNTLITKAAQPNVTEVPVTKAELNLLLGSAANVSFNKHRSAIYKTLLIAKSTDGTDVDATIAKFVTGREMLAEVKEVLLRDVLRIRNNPAIIPTLLTFASTSSDAKATTAALRAIRFMAEDRHFDTLLKIIESTSNAEVRRAAEETATEIIRKSSFKEKLADTLARQFATALNHEIRHSLLRLLGACGGEKALATVREILAGSDQQQIIAAIMALGSWGDHNGFPALVDFLKESRDPNMRARAFDAAQKYLSQAQDNPNEAEQWTMLSNQAKTREEMMKIVQGVANLEGDWPMKLVQTYMKSEDDQVAQKAERALDYMNERRKLNEE